jgi:hypothetical protein
MMGPEKSKTRGDGIVRVGVPHFHGNELYVQRRLYLDLVPGR